MLGPYSENTIVVGDCLEVMAQMPDGCTDLVLCDLPYGTTACKWDVIIPFEPLWDQYKRIAKENTAIVLMASQPFTSMLVMSNLKMFKYDWVWEKAHAANFMAAKYRPLKKHESVLVFCKSPTKYNPQMTTGARKLNRGGKVLRKRDKDSIYGSRPAILANVESYTYYPSTVQYFSAGAMCKRIHPTQKPVALFEYLIKTYTDEGDLVLDNRMGSGTTALAADRLGRTFFGCDINPDYVEMALRRIAQDREQRAQMELF